MEKIWTDDGLSLYKVTYMDKEQYCVWKDISDVVAWYEDQEFITHIKYIGIAYLSPSIIK